MAGKQSKAHILTEMSLYERREGIKEGKSYYEGVPIGLFLFL